jgi:hypothetical protein
MNAEVTNQWAHKILILQEKAQKQFYLKKAKIHL